ncbi:hypothetical protein SB49_14015 [Sediminicola sp. YIK13]|nr:hypothetical protein SB49_14015 [Sediminicola sp. YIK13]
MASCALICYQDFKERTVFWFLFPILGISIGIMHYLYVETPLFIIYITINFLLTSLILLLLYLYTKLIRKVVFLNHSFGLGDLLFFYAIGFGFPTITFVVIFSTSVLFSLLVYLGIKKSLKQNTVPLAGLMGLFLICVFAISFFKSTPSLYLN